MNGGFIDPVVEPILWLIVSVTLAGIAIYFFLLYRKVDEEAKPFILGLSLFLLTFCIARTIETIRRFWYGSYDEIVAANFTLTGLDLTLRMLYYVVSWSGISIFYYVLEKHTLKQGFRKNTRYILVISSIAEAVFTISLYFTSAASWIVLFVTIFFLIAAFFPVILFLYIIKIAPQRNQKKIWLIICIGFIFFLLGVMGDLPESYLVVTQYIGAPYLPPMLIHYGTPILQATGVIFMGFGFARNEKRVET